MFRKSIATISSVALTLLIAGCGGSGAIKTIPDKKPTPNLPSPNPTPGQNVYRSMSAYNSTKHATEGSVTQNAPSFDTLSFNGRELPLMVAGNIKPGRMVAIDTDLTLGGVSYKKFHVGSTRHSHARFGALNYEGNNIVFHQGHLSASVPNKGAAHYVGDVVHVNNANNNYTQGIMQADVNFADKRMKLAFTKPGDKSKFVDRYLEATLNGNKFSGITNNTHVDGAFYGDNANEMAGHYTNAQENFQGAFGGTMQTSRGIGAK